jgi:hypothetical protein
MYIQCDYFGCMLNVLVAHFSVVPIMLSLRSLHGANLNFDFCHVVVVVLLLGKDCWYSCWPLVHRTLIVVVFW